MTVEIPDFDQSLEGHACLVIDETVHARVGEGVDADTECGLKIPEPSARGARKDFVDADIEMCRNCWPEEVL